MKEANRAVRQAESARREFDRAAHDLQRAQDTGRGSSEAEANFKEKADALKRDVAAMVKAMLKLQEATAEPSDQTGEDGKPPTDQGGGAAGGSAGPQSRLSKGPVLPPIACMEIKGEPVLAAKCHEEWCGKCDENKGEHCVSCHWDKVPPPTDAGVKGKGMALAAGIMLAGANSKFSRPGSSAPVGSGLNDAPRENRVDGVPVRTSADGAVGGVSGQGSAVAPSGSAPISQRKSPEASEAAGGGAPAKVAQGPGVNQAGKGLPPALFPGQSVAEDPQEVSKVYRLHRWLAWKTSGTSLTQEQYYSLYDLAMRATGHKLIQSLPKDPMVLSPEHLAVTALDKSLSALDETLTRLNDVLDKSAGGTMQLLAGGVGGLVAGLVSIVDPELGKEIHEYAKAAIAQGQNQFGLIGAAISGERPEGSQVSGKRVGDFLVRMGVAAVDFAAARLLPDVAHVIEGLGALAAPDDKQLYRDLAEALREFAEVAPDVASMNAKDAWDALGKGRDITAGMSDSDRLLHVIARELLNPLNWLGGKLTVVALRRLKGLVKLRRATKVPCPPCPGGKPGTSVIGQYPEYVDLADELAANRFSIPKAQWDAMSEAERWSANQKFLDDAIARGDTFRLATPLDKVHPGSYFQKEVNYLQEHGYTLSGDGGSLLPPGGK